MEIKKALYPLSQTGMLLYLARNERERERGTSKRTSEERASAAPIISHLNGEVKHFLYTKPKKITWLSTDLHYWQ